MSYWNIPPSGHGDEDEKKRREEAERAALLRQFLTPEARQRLKNVALVKPDLAKKVETIIIQLGIEGRLDHRLTDDEVKEILYRLQRKKDYRIRGF